MPYGKEKKRQFDRRRREISKAFFKEYLSQHPCVDCGQDDIRTLEFDHVRGIKSFTVKTCGSMTVEKILKEIEKCDIRCANCHKIRHHTQRNMVTMV